MGRIQTNVGLITGFPIQETVDKLMAVNARPRDLLVSRNKQLASEQTAIADLTAAMLAVQFAGEALGKESLFNSKTATSSNGTALGAAVSGSPAAGNYQFTPLQKAQSQQLISLGFASKTTPIGEGTITLQRGGFVDEGLNLDVLNGGQGVARGKIRITDRSGASAEIDLRFAVNVDDVLSAINNAANIDVTAIADGDRIRLIDNTGSTTSNLRVQEVAGGTTAAGLGLAGISVAANEALGGDVVRLAGALKLSQLRDGLGVSLRDGLADLQVSFRDGSSDLLVDFEALTSADRRESATLGELLSAINAADPTRLAASVSGDGQRIVLTDLTADNGGQFTVSSPFGGSVAQELGLVGTASSDTLTGGQLLSGLKDTLLSSLNGGAGLGHLGNLLLTDRSGANATVDLSGAETLSQVTSAINNAGIGIAAKINSSRNGIVLTDTSGGTGNLAVGNDADGTSTAAKLKLEVDAAVASVNSGSLKKQTVSRQTKLTTYNNGGEVTAGKFVITNSAGTAAVIDLTNITGKTIGDVIDAINATNISVKAEINASGDGIRLVDNANGTATLKVTSSSGQTAAGLKLLGSATLQDIGGTPKQVIDGSSGLKITISDTDTLETLAEKINSLSAGVTASIVSDGSGATPHRLSLVSKSSGKAGELLIDASASSLTFTEVVKAQDARLLFGSTTSGGILASSSTNQFTGLVAGLTLTVENSSTDPVTINVTESDKSFISSIETFVSQFNRLNDKIKQHSFFNAEDNSVGILFGSNETLRLENDLSRLLSGRFSGSSTIRSLEQLGVSFGEDGKLSLDKEKLSAAYASDAAGVKDFFTKETTGFVAKLKGVADSLVGANNSMLINRSVSLSAKVDLYNERIERMNTRLETQKEQMLKQFYAMETAIAKLQDSLSAISQIKPITPT